MIKKDIGYVNFDFYSKLQVNVTYEVDWNSMGFPKVLREIQVALAIMAKLVCNFPPTKGPIFAGEALKRYCLGKDQEPTTWSNVNLSSIWQQNKLAFVSRRDQDQKRYRANLTLHDEDGFALIADTKIVRGNEEYFHKATLDALFESTRLNVNDCPAVYVALGGMLAFLERNGTHDIRQNLQAANSLLLQSAEFIPTEEQVMDQASAIKDNKANRIASDAIHGQRPAATNMGAEPAAPNLKSKFIRMDDSEYYLQATKEVDSDNVIEALWAKAMALCSGDERQAKYEYIKLRVALLSSGVEDQQVSQNNPNPQESGMSDSIPIEESAQEPGSHPRTKPPEKHLNQYMPIQEFASITGIAVEDLRKNIGDNLLSGKFENGEWHVRKGQVGEWVGRKGQKDTSFVVGESKRGDAEHSDPDSQVNENSLDTLADPLTESGTNQQDKSEEYRKGFLSAHQFATANGTTVEKVIQDIRDGELVGEIRDGSWYVQTKLTTSDSDDDAELKRDFMPIAQFSDATNLTIETIIDKIRAGEIRGEMRV